MDRPAQGLTFVASFAPCAPCSCPSCSPRARRDRRPCAGQRRRRRRARHLPPALRPEADRLRARHDRPRRRRARAHLRLRLHRPRRPRAARRDAQDVGRLHADRVPIEGQDLSLRERGLRGDGRRPRGDGSRRRQGRATVALPPAFFVSDGYAPFAAQMLLLRYWRGHGRPHHLQTVPGDAAERRHRRRARDRRDRGRRAARARCAST